MTPDEETEYIARSKEMIERSARHAIEEFRLAHSLEPNCLFVSHPFLEAGMHVGCREDRPGTIHGHIDPETQVGKLHVFNLKTYPLDYLPGFAVLAAIITDPT